MDESSPNFSYRSLELLCLQQAKLSATPEAREELERMALEYRRLRVGFEPEQPADRQKCLGPQPDG
jgi:hypothetical protein